MSHVITFTPSESMNEFMNLQIDIGNYDSQVDIIGAGLRLLQEKQEMKLQKLRELIEEAENSPIIENWNAEDFMSRMEDKYANS